MDDIVNEPAVAYQKRSYTVKEYLEMEKASTVKHEYSKGRYLQCLALVIIITRFSATFLGKLETKLKVCPAGLMEVINE